MVRTTIQKLQNKAPNLFNDLSDSDKIEFLYSKRNSQMFKKILKHNTPDSLSQFYDMLNRCYELGSTVTSEAKLVILYGEKEGKKKWFEYRGKISNTLKSFQEKYGKELGTKKWNEYCDKQAYSNSFEYKQQNHGMTEEEFNEYNKSRASTLEKMIKRHGKELGTKKWNEYREKQAYTNTEEYLGTERYLRINKLKSHNMENYIRRYGVESAEEKLDNFYRGLRSGYSKISQELFWRLLNELDWKNPEKIYFAEHNGEYGVYDKENKAYKKYDFVSVLDNLCIEFHGDHYHGNPKLYSPTDFLKGRGQTKTKAKDIWEQDLSKTLLIEEERGYNVLVVWESEYRSNPDQIVERIEKYVRNNRKS